MKKRYTALLLIMIAAVLMALLSGCGAANDENSADAGTKRIYISGPFFNETELANVERVEKILEDKGYDYFSPMRHTVDAEEGTTEWADAIFEVDRTEIDKCDVMVVIYYGSYSDSGTAWECGYAVAKGIPVVLVHVDKDSDSNLMMHSSATANIYIDELEDYDFETMPESDYEGEMF